MTSEVIEHGCRQKPDRQNLRLLKLLARAAGGTLAMYRDEKKVTISLEGRKFAFPARTIGYLERDGLVQVDGSRISMTGAGNSHLKRMLHPEHSFAAQHGDRSQSNIRDESGERIDVLINESESPLLRLYRRKASGGESWINEMEFRAGERFRTDFNKARLQPRVSANWEASVASRGRSGGSAGDLSDMAIDARQRLNTAVDALGPELADICLDVCCFLKGLETVEREHGWPTRSAKLMLRTALRALVRHYGMESGNGRRGTRSWGTQDYRPTVD